MFYTCRRDYKLTVMSIVCSGQLLVPLLSSDCSMLQVFDATNTTRERRQMILDFCRPADMSRQYSVFFIESLCDNRDTVIRNIKVSR